MDKIVFTMNMMLRHLLSDLIYLASEGMSLPSKTLGGGKKDIERLFKKRMEAPARDLVDRSVFKYTHR